MYPNHQALKELERLEEISINKKLSERKKDSSGLLKISSLNCRSLKKHYPDISSDDLLLESDMICLQETWLDDNTIIEDLMIPNYKLHLNSHGKGKGIAIYFNKNVLIMNKTLIMKTCSFQSSTHQALILLSSTDHKMEIMRT